jgi:hypothetical protein
LFMPDVGTHFERFRAIADRLHELGEVEVKVLWLCESWMDKRTHDFVASAAGIAQRLSFSDRAVEQAMKSLRDKGFLETIGRSTGGRGRSALRRLLVARKTEPINGELGTKTEPTNGESGNTEPTNTVCGQHKTPNHGAQNSEPRRAPKETCFHNLLSEPAVQKVREGESRGCGGAARALLREKL